VISATGFSPPPFCDGCGAAHSWARREQRLYELQNILDQEEIDDVDRLWIDEQMDRLRADDGSITEKQEKDIWVGVRKRAPGLFGTAGKAVLSGVISAGSAPPSGCSRVGPGRVGGVVQHRRHV
jgi:hypothetical protein